MRIPIDQPNGDGVGHRDGRFRPVVPGQIILVEHDTDHVRADLGEAVFKLQAEFATGF